MQFSKIFQFHKTPAGIITLIPQDAVHFQGVADTFMDLEHHLVRGNDHIHFPAGTFICCQQFQGLLADFAGLGHDLVGIKIFHTHLTAGSAHTAKGTGLLIRPVCRCGPQVKLQHQEVLTNVAAVGTDKLRGNFDYLAQGCCTHDLV